MIKLVSKRITEGDGNYYITIDGIIYHKKGKTKFLNPYKNRKVYCVDLYNDGKKKKYSIEVIHKKYWSV